VYYRKGRIVGEDLYLYIAKAGPHPTKPEHKSFVRVDNYQSTIAVKHIDNDTAEFRLLYHDDMKGSIPKGIVNWYVYEILEVTL
jgi:hypothetical protein